MNSEMRSGANWDKFMTDFRLRDIRDAQNGNGWIVDSASGKIYSVTREVSRKRYAESDFYWTCNCPARKRCRHIDAVEQMLHAEIHSAIEAGDDGGIDDMEILERTT